MPEQTTAIDYVMEAASGPHFSGLYLDSRSNLSSSSLIADSIKQPFVIGTINYYYYYCLIRIIIQSISYV